MGKPTSIRRTKPRTSLVKELTVLGMEDESTFFTKSDREMLLRLAEAAGNRRGLDADRKNMRATTHSPMPRLYSRNRSKPKTCRETQGLAELQKSRGACAKSGSILKR